MQFQHIPPNPDRDVNYLHNVFGSGPNPILDAAHRLIHADS
jgi:hypothetical protein